MTDSNNASRTTSSRTGLSSLLGISAVLPGIGATLLPAVTCPACWPAYAGLMGSLGLGFVDYTPWLMPVTVVFLTIALAALAWQGYRRRDYRPFGLGASGAAILVIGKFQMDSEVALYSGITLIIAASVWNAWPRKVCPTGSQSNACGCE